MSGNASDLATFISDEQLKCVCTSKTVDDETYYRCVAMHPVGRDAVRTEGSSAEPDFART